MAVPTSGNFEMFGTGSNTTIAGAIVEGGANVDGLTTFNQLIAASTASRFDFDFAGAVSFPPTDITQTYQFRGYPVDPGNCRAIWVDDTVDSSRYGARYILPSGQQIDVVYSSLFGTPYVYGGNSGVVYNVCSTQSPSTWDSVTNTLVDLGGLVVDFVDGGSCYENIECEWIAPPTQTPTGTPTNTPTPTGTPTQTPTNTPTPTVTPTPSPVRYYYQLASCVDGPSNSIYVYRDGLPIIGPGDSYNYFSNCYEYYDVAVNGTIDVDGLTTCICPTPTPTPTNTPTNTPTPTPTTPDPYNYYFIQHCEGEPLDRVVRTTQTFTVGNNSTGTYVSIFGQGYVVVSGATKNEYDTNAGDESSYDLGSTSYPSIGCPVAPTPTPTPTPTRSTICQYVFVPNTVSTTDRGLRYNNGGEVNTSFSSLFGVPSYEGGVNGVVYGVCTTTSPQWLIVSSNVTTTFPSGVYVIGTGGSCSDNTPDCEWTPTQPPVTPTPTPTSTPVTYYYQLAHCNDGPSNSIYVYSVGTQITNGDAFSYFSNCYEYYDVDPGQTGTIDLAGLSTCVCATPTPTPTSTPPPVTPTPTPSSTPPCGTVETLGDGATSNDACNDFAAGTGTVRYLDGPFPFASIIYRNPDCTGLAAAGYYSDGSAWRYWNGTIFTGLNGLCPSY